MRTIISASALLLFAAAPLAAQSGAYRAQPSTRATAEVALALTDTAAQRAAGKPALITINYGQPHLRGRTLLTGDLVPTGTVWRLGANEATILSTDVDMMIGDKQIPKGRYILSALPETSGWTLILQQETSGSPMVMAMNYDPAKDFARIPLRSSPVSEAVESLSIALVPATTPGEQRGVLHISWGKVHLNADWVVR